MASRNSLDMTQGPVFRKLLLFAYPLMINTLINTLYGTVDKIVAGRFISDNAMAAVGASEQPLMLLLNFFISIGAGVSVCCGSHLGGNRKQDLRECMHTAVLSSFFCGVAVCIFGMAVSKPLLVSMETPPEILPEALTYMMVRMVGTPIQLMTTFCTNILTSHGDTKRITVVGIVSGLVNVVGNLLFVLGFGMGVESLAIATVLSQVFSLVIKLYILFSPKDNYRMKLSQLRVHWRHLKEILSIGIPSGIHAIVFSLSNVIVQASVNSFGATVVAGNAAADTLMQFVFLFPNQIAAACCCAAAQCYGAGDYVRIHRVAKQGIVSSLIMLVAASIPMTLLSETVLGLFTEDSVVARAGIPNLLFSCWGFAIYTFSLIYCSVLRGMHKTMAVMVINAASICASRVLWVLLVFPHFGTPAMLYIVYPISWLISSVFISIYYHCTRKRLVAAQMRLTANNS